MPHILLTSTYTIQNPATGGKRRVAELFRALQPEAVLLQPEPPVPGADCDTFPRDFGKRKVGINWGIFNLYWPPNHRAAERAVIQHAPDVLLGTSIWCHDVFSIFPIPRILDAQNVDSIAMAERFGKNHFFTKWVFAQEKKVCRESAGIFCCSDIDAEWFGRLYGVPEKKICMVPNGVRLEKQAALTDPAANDMAAALTGKTILYFMGKLDYAPNVEALGFLVQSVLPALEAARPGQFACVVSGGPALPAGIHHPILHYVGQVPHIGPWLDLADICLAPVFSGSGTRLKVLEYMAAEKPVVATAKAVEGLAVADGREFLLADKNDFADKILYLQQDTALQTTLGAAGRRLVEQSYSWEQSARAWRNGLAVFMEQAKLQA